MAGCEGVTGLIYVSTGGYQEMVELLLTGYFSKIDEHEEAIEIADDEDVTVLCPSLMGPSVEYAPRGEGIRKPGL